MLARLAGLHAPLLLDSTLADQNQTPLVTSQNVQQVLELCRELLQAVADEDLPADMRETAVEQLRIFHSQLAANKLQLTDNGCRELIEGRLTKVSRQRAHMQFLALIHRTLTELEAASESTVAA